ncbi:hypothetical protein GHT06_018202 [Daphnia sinensis]|uniref:Uncharacterized protein n=1 Tax=Daphnia sinensis TaxID=1820382 RepID=A0AAD5KM78_9CRUS|nr:hypothetical protein GHT06_018202 [Daphnia sinensis]
MECYAIYDESISAFFSGSGGGVVIVMIWLIQIILSGYTSLSDRLGPDNPSNQNRFIALNVMECLVYSGAASNLYHSRKIQLIDVLILNGSLGIFHLGHVLFFLNPWLCYHGLYGAIHAALCIGTPLLAFNVSSSHAASGSDPSEGDDPSLATDWQSVRQVEIGCVGLLCCLWYSLETHVVVWKRHRFRFEQHQDCFFVMLCFGYADVWNVMAKCSKAYDSRAFCVNRTFHCNYFKFYTARFSFTLFLTFSGTVFVNCRFIARWLVIDVTVLKTFIVYSMSNKIIFASMSVFLMFGGCIFARSVPSEFPFDTTTKSNNSHNEDQTTAPLLNERNPGDDEPLTNRVPSSSDSSDSGFGWSWRNLIPRHFGEFFEVFVFFMELKWHYEIEESIAAVGHRISNDLSKNNMDQMEMTETDSGGSETTEVDSRLATAKYLQYYLNAMAPLYGIHSIKPDLSKIQNF